MRLTTKEKLVLVSVFGLMFCLASFVLMSIAGMAQAAEPTVIKKADLPALKGGKATAKKDASGIPSCRAGRAVLPASDEAVKTWAAEHEKHECATADKVYVCKAFGALSVRCE